MYILAMWQHRIIFKRRGNPRRAQPGRTPEFGYGPYLESNMLKLVKVWRQPERYLVQKAPTGPVENR